MAPMSRHRHGLGRPKLPKGEAMSRQLTCRVRPTEEARMKAAADRAGLPLAEWMRRALLHAAGIKGKPKSATKRPPRTP